MALNYDELISTTINDIPFRYDDRDAILYALSIGMGRDPLTRRELPFVYEQSGEPLRTVPSLATVLVPEMFPPDLGWDYSQVLHSEQRMQLPGTLRTNPAGFLFHRITATHQAVPKSQRRESNPLR